MSLKIEFKGGFAKDLYKQQPRNKSGVTNALLSIVEVVTKLHDGSGIGFTENALVGEPV